MKSMFIKIILVSIIISLFAGCVQAPTENTTVPPTTTSTGAAPAGIAPLNAGVLRSVKRSTLVAACGCANACVRQSVPANQTVMILAESRIRREAKCLLYIFV